MSVESDSPQQVSPRGDLVSACVWIAFGAAICIGSWNMDRLEKLNINKYEIPGLVPGLLGAAIVALGIALVLRSIARGALRPEGAPAPAPAGSRGFMALVMGAMLLYSVVLVGHGLPFWLVTAVFVAAFIFLFDQGRQSALGRTTARQLLLAAACGVVTSAVVTLAFQEIFYVRLP